MDSLLDRLSLGETGRYTRAWLCDPVVLLRDGLGHDPTVVLVSPNDEVRRVVKHVLRHKLVLVVSDTGIVLKTRQLRLG